MENKNSYTIVGVFFLVCLFAIGIFMWWMGAKDSNNLKMRQYYILTKELPTGLKTDSQVKFAGVLVGNVSKIDFAKDNSALIEITMTIRDDIPIKKDSKADVEMQILSGISTINIGRGSDNSEIFSSNDKYPIVELEKNLLSRIGNNAEDITVKLNRSLDKLESFFNEKNIAHFQKILENFEKFTDELSDKDSAKKAKKLIDNLNEITYDINKSIASFTKNVDTLTKETSVAIKNFNSSQSLIRSRIERGDFNLKDMFSPTLNEFTITMNELKKTLKEFKNTLYRLEDNPYEFFFTNRKTTDEEEK